MTGLIKSITDLKKYVRVAGTMQDGSWKPFMLDAQNKYIRPYLGDTLLGKLDTWYNATNPATNLHYTNLLPYVQSALAKFIIGISAHANNLQVTESGFVVTSNGNLAPASMDRVKGYIDSMIAAGYDNIETMLRFLEANRSNYADWMSSDAYTQNRDSLIPNAVEFDKCIYIDQSRLKFTEMKRIMQDVELLRIKPVISEAMFLDITAKALTNNLGNYSAILPLLRRSVANFTFWEKTANRSFLTLGEAFLAEVKKIIDTTPTNYPLYMNSACYDAAKTSYRAFENTEDDTVFVMGS
jgi:hypothetical protein